MAYSNQTFIEEAFRAIKGCWALVVGRRDASGFFDFSQRGLLGSLIAVLLAILLAGFAPVLLGAPIPAGAPTQSVIVNGVLFVAQASMAWIVLRQIGRQDGFVPYLVATNWITLVSGALVLLATLFGQIGMGILLAVVVLALVTFVNIGRHIVTLKPIQIAMLFISQAVGVFLALGVIAIVLPPVPMP